MLKIVRLDVDLRKTNVYSYQVNPIVMKTGCWNGDVHSTAEGSDLIGTGGGFEGFEDVVPGNRPREEYEIWDIPTIDGWLSGCVISPGCIKCIRHFETGAVQYPHS